MGGIQVRRGLRARPWPSAFARPRRSHDILVSGGFSVPCSEWR